MLINLGQGKTINSAKTTALSQKLDKHEHQARSNHHFPNYHRGFQEVSTNTYMNDLPRDKSNWIAYRGIHTKLVHTPISKSKNRMNRRKQVHMHPGSHSLTEQFANCLADATLEINYLHPFLKGIICIRCLEVDTKDNRALRNIDR